MKAIVYDFSTDIFPTDEETDRLCKKGCGADTCVWLTVDARGFVCRSKDRPMYLVDRWEAGKHG